MAVLTYNEQELQHLRKLALSGDDTATSMILTESRRLQNIANKRLKRLEESGLSSSAYDVATSRIGRKRFSIRKDMSIDELLDEFREMRSFVRQETSTVRGVKYAKKRLFETLEAYDLGVNEDDYDKFWEVIKSDEIQDFIDYVGDYDLVFDLVSINIREMRKSVEDLKRDFDSFFTRDYKYDEFINKMLKGSSYNYEEIHSRHRKRQAYRDSKRARTGKSNRR